MMRSGRRSIVSTLGKSQVEIAEAVVNKKNKVQILFGDFFSLMCIIINDVSLYIISCYYSIYLISPLNFHLRTIPQIENSI